MGMDAVTNEKQQHTQTHHRDPQRTGSLPKPCMKPLYSSPERRWEGGGEGGERDREHSMNKYGTMRGVELQKGKREAATGWTADPRSSPRLAPAHRSLGSYHRPRHPVRHNESPQNSAASNNKHMIFPVSVGQKFGSSLVGSFFFFF